MDQPVRLDELVNVTDGHDVFTFSFDHALADMRLDITAVGINEYEIRIHGTAFGGLVVDNQYDATMSGVVDIDFVYMLAHPAGGDDDLIVTTPNFTNTGSITFEGVPINLFDRANSDGFTFRLGDENDDQGHRGFDGISGFGWLDHGTAGNHVVSSDWLFTVIPTPGSVALLTMAFAIVARGKRRRLVSSTQAISYLPERRAMLRTAVLGREKHADPDMPAACFSRLPSGRLPRLLC